MYQEEIRRYAPLTIENIIHTAEVDIPCGFRSMPWTYSDAAGRTLERGTAILETEELCSAYLAAYGRMHRHKLFFALDRAREKGISLIANCITELNFLIGDVGKA